MKLSSKIALVFTLISLLSIGSILIYTSVVHRETYIEDERHHQDEVLNLLTNQVDGMYYNYIYDQITALYYSRNILRDHSRVLRDALEGHQFKDEDELKTYLTYKQKTFNKINMDLIAVKNSEIFLNPKNKDLFTGKRVLNSLNLMDAILYSYQPIKDDFLCVFNDSDDDNDYLVYVNNIESISLTIAIALNINDLTSSYTIDDKQIIEDIKSNFDKMNLDLDSDQLSIIIIDANAKKIVVDANVDEIPIVKKGVIPQVLIEKLIPKNGVQNSKVEIFNKKYFTSLKYFKPLNWYVVSLSDEDEVIEPAVQTEHFLLLIGVIVLIITFVVSIITSSGLTKAIRKLESLANKISNIDLSDPKALLRLNKEFDVTGDDEVSHVQRAFIAMNQTLSENLHNLFKANTLKDKLQGELKAAREIQLGMLTPFAHLPQSKTLECSAFLTPAKEVGGDFYDVFNVDDDKVAFCIGDVSDKGVPAALFMSTTLNLARTFLNLGFSPKDAMTNINNRLSEQNPNMMFVTMFIMVINKNTGEFVASNAGHCLPIVISKQLDSVTELEEISGPAVGAIGDIEYKQYQGKLATGDLVLLYTDGVSEAQNSNKEFFGVEKILKLSSTLKGSSPENTKDVIVDAVNKYRGDYMQTDDITVLSLKYTN